MAIIADTRRTEPIVTVGGEILLPVPYRILAARDLAVQLERGGRPYRLVYGYDYIVDGVGADDGGHVRLLRAALPGDIYVVEGARPHERATDIVQQKVLDARFLNDELDSLQVQIQELRRDIGGVVARLPADLLLPPINAPLPDPHDEYLKKLITGAAEMTGSAGQIAAEATAWAERTAEASIRDLLGQIEGKSGYTQDLTVQVDRNGALVQMIETLAATVDGDVAAAIQAEEQARVDADGALASAQQDIFATLGTKASTASVATVAEAQAATANGLTEVRAYIGIVLQAGGRIGFFKMDGTPAEVSAVFGLDKFILVDAAGMTKVPFVTGFIDGVATTTLGNLIADGAVVARHVEAGSITADKMNVTSLSAIVANLGTITAGLLKDAGDTVRFDVPNQRWYRVDGKAQLDLKNMIFEFLP